LHIGFKLYELGSRPPSGTSVKIHIDIDTIYDNFLGFLQVDFLMVPPRFIAFSIFISEMRRGSIRKLDYLVHINNKKKYYVIATVFEKKLQQKTRVVPFC
jgi:hypothetical protein